MSKERWVVSELEKRYGVETTRRWLANLANLQLIGDSMADDVDRLADLLDVLLTNPQDGDTLRYDVITSRWKNSNGGSQPVTRALLRSSASVLIASGNTDFLLCDQQLSGDPIFDLSDPANPAAVASGTYAVTATIRPFDAMAVGDFYFANLEIDALGEDATTSTLSEQAFAASTKPLIVLPLTWYCPAGGVLRFSVENDATTDLSFRLLSAFVQRIA